jgi:hypothetical protein
MSMSQQAKGNSMRMTTRSQLSWSGAAATVGGTLLSLFAVLADSKPTRCVSDTCDRNYSDVAPVALAGILLIAAACAGIARRSARNGTMNRLLKAGTILAGIGIVLLLLAVPANQVSGNLPPLFVLPGVAALAVGVLLFGVDLLRTGVLPRYASVSLIVGGLAVLGVNDVDWRILFLVPFGVAWIIAGIALLWARRSDGSPTRTL